MLNSRTKNKIYAMISILVIISLVISFLGTINFIIKMNGLLFNVDNEMIKEKTVILNIEGYNNIKNKIENN